MSLTPWNRQEEWYQAMIDAAGSGGLPEVTSADAGKVLAVNNSGVWGAQEPIGKKFIVTLTPTAADYSGTMDKTVAEINAAYEAGREIVARVITGQDTYADIHVSNIVKNTEVYPSYTFYLITLGKMIVAYTGYTDDGTKQTYGATIYNLSYPSASGVSF